MAWLASGEWTVAGSGDSELDEKISEWLSLDQVNMIYEGGFPGHLFRISHSYEYILDTCCVYGIFPGSALAYLEAESYCLNKG